MCRQNLLYGSCLLAFGIGVLTGTWFSSGLVGHLLGFGVIALGIVVLRKR